MKASVDLAQLGQEQRPFQVPLPSLEGNHASNSVPQSLEIEKRKKRGEMPCRLWGIEKRRSSLDPRVLSSTCLQRVICKLYWGVSGAGREVALDFALSHLLQETPAWVHRKFPEHRHSLDSQTGDCWGIAFSSGGVTCHLFIRVIPGGHWAVYTTPFHKVSMAGHCPGP